MATTVSPAVSNSFGSASVYLPILDEIYKAESKTAILDTAQDRVYYDPKAHTFNLFEIDMVGNADYSRNDGFVRGDVTAAWRSYAPQYDRGRQFVVDRVDDAEVPYEGRILFVNPTTYRLLKGGITRMTMNGENGIDYNIEMYNDMRVITVPKGRFNTALTLLQPDSHDDVGGYALTGSTINFLIIHPSAIMQANCFTEPRIFSPGVWQQSQGWAWDFRQYHGAWVKHQKTNGIYVNAPTVVSA